RPSLPFTTFMGLSAVRDPSRDLLPNVRPGRPPHNMPDGSVTDIERDSQPRDRSPGIESRADSADLPLRKPRGGVTLPRVRGKCARLRRHYSILGRHFKPQLWFTRSHKPATWEHRCH